MKLQTKKKLAQLFLKLVHPIYKGGLKIKHNGKRHHVMKISKLKLKALTK